MTIRFSARATGCVALLLSFGATLAAEPQFRHYVAGNPADVVTPTRGFVVMQGGGTDVDLNYERMGELGGGDQSRYVRFLKNTPVEEAINHVAAKPAPLGGTSAGMAIMGEYVYSAMGEASLAPGAALGDPFHPDVTLAIEDVDVYRLAPGGTFDLDDWQGSSGIAYTLRVVDGELVSSRDEIY